FQGGPGQDGDELDELHLVVAEEVGHLVVGDVQAGDRSALAGDGRAQSRTEAGDDDAVCRIGGGGVGEHGRAAAFEGPPHEGAAPAVEAAAGAGVDHVVVVDVEDEHALHPEQGRGGLADGGEDGGGGRGRRDVPAHVEQGGEPVGERQGGGGGGGPGGGRGLGIGHRRGEERPHLSFGVRDRTRADAGL